MPGYAFSLKYRNTLLLDKKQITVQQAVDDPEILKAAVTWLQANWPKPFPGVFLLDLGTINQLIGDPADPALVDVRVLSQSHYARYQLPANGVYSIDLLEEANDPLPLLRKLFAENIPLHTEIRLVGIFRVMITQQLI